LKQWNRLLEKKEFIIISGGTSEIGESIIRELIPHFNIIFTYAKSKIKADRIINKYKKIDNLIINKRLNLFSEKSIKVFSKYLLSKNFYIRGFIHNAWEKVSRQDFVKIKKEILKKMIVSNCFGTFLLTQEIAKLMIKNKGLDKSITFISSQAADYGGNKISPYASSKGFINSLNNSLSKELGKYNIRVNAVSPGKIITSSMKKNFKKDFKNVAKDIPLGYLGKPEDVAIIVKNILVNSPYLSGANIKISGGR
tara:strand:+ start:11257 stop:12015 length:759 start_codon:yes stop_codon:yes gene_type:complete